MNEGWMQIITIMMSNLGVILWFRKESRDDWIRCENTLVGIREEMKDFHERLLQIEMERKK